MTSAATRNFVRHAGDHDVDWLLEQERKADERQEALLARQEALRESNPELAALVEKKVGRRR